MYTSFRLDYSILYQKSKFRFDGESPQTQRTAWVNIRYTSYIARYRYLGKVGCKIILNYQLLPARCRAVIFVGGGAHDAPNLSRGRRPRQGMVGEHVSYTIILPHSRQFVNSALQNMKKAL